MHHAHLPVFHETLSRRGIIADITEHSAAARSLMGVEVDVGLEDGVGWGWDAGKGVCGGGTCPAVGTEQSSRSGCLLQYFDMSLRMGFAKASE